MFWLITFSNLEWMAGPSRRATGRRSGGVPSQEDSQPIVVLDLDLNSTPSESSELEESSSTSFRRINPTGNLLESAPPPHTSIIDVDQIEDVSGIIYISSLFTDWYEVWNYMLQEDLVITFCLHDINVTQMKGEDQGRQRSSTANHIQIRRRCKILQR